MYHSLHCTRCGDAVDSMPGAWDIACPRCAAPLAYRFDLPAIARDGATDPSAGPGLWRWWRLLPVPPDAPRVTLAEGGTPIIPSALPGPWGRLLWKDETRNPTGSHKDRALAVAATQALSIGARRCLVVSAGSTGLSNAAYAARAGLPSITVTARGAPPERLQPLAAYGTRVIEVDVPGIDPLIAAAQHLHGQDGTYLASTTRRSNPAQAEAAKTIAYEIVEALGDAPDWVVVPTGGGGTIAALWRGFGDMCALGLAARLPRLAAVVPARYGALAEALARGITGEDAFAAMAYTDDVPTLLTKLAHAHPPDGIEALTALRESGGTVVPVTDEAAIAAVAAIGGTDGLYLEPSSAVALPALQHLAASGAVRSSETVVALACGAGHRETFALLRHAPLRPAAIELPGLRDAVLS